MASVFCGRFELHIARRTQSAYPGAGVLLGLDVCGARENKETPQTKWAAVRLRRSGKTAEVKPSDAMQRICIAFAGRNQPFIWS
jgi:hypothetical protein